MKNPLVVIALVAVILALAGAYVFTQKEPVQPVGGTAGPVSSELFEFQRNFFNSGQYATTSNGTSITLTANEFRAWANSSIVSFTPIATAASTFTFPASSTVSNLVPHAGDRQSFCFRNATSTAGVQITLAGSTGINLVVASSSVSAVGSKLVNSGKVACITLIRQAPTATTFDIDALLTAYQ